MKQSMVVVMAAVLVVQPLHAADDVPDLEIGKLKNTGSPLLMDPRIKQECRLDQQRVTGGVLAPILVSWFANLAIKGYITHLTNKLNKYSETYGAGPLWSDGGVFLSREPETGEDVGKVHEACFVFRRMSCKDPAATQCEKKELGVELVGQIRVSDTYMQVRPLGVYYASTKAPAVKQAGVAFAVTIDALWAEQGVGQRLRAAESAVIASETLTVGKDKHTVIGFKDEGTIQNDNPKLYLDSSGGLVPWTDYPRFLRLPVDHAGGSSVGLSVSVAEVGTPPRYLKALQKFVSDNQEQLSPLLAEAIAKQVGVDLEE